MGMMQGMEGVVIWGTNVNVKESMARFRQFLLEFKLDDEDEPLYRSQLEEIHRTQVVCDSKYSREKHASCCCCCCYRSVRCPHQTRVLVAL